MRQAKHTGYSKAELNKLYELTDSWTDISGLMADGKDVEFKVEDLRVFYALPARTAQQVVRLARRRRTTPERLIERWVNEKLAETR